MPTRMTGSRALLRALRSVMAGSNTGQQRLDTVVTLVARNMVAEVCSIHLKRDEHTLELCATEGPDPASVHRARLRVGQGLVGRIAQNAEPILTDDARSTPGFRYLPETREEAYTSFVGVPVQRLGEILGVLVVQNAVPRKYTEEEVEALEVVAMVIAEMTEAGAFLDGGGETLSGPGRRTGPLLATGASVSDGVAEGTVHLHEPRLIVFDPIADDVETGRGRLAEAMEHLRAETDRLLTTNAFDGDGEHREILETYRMFAHNKGWMRRLDEAIESGLAAEVAVEKVQSDARARMERSSDPYLRERLQDLDDLAIRLLRHLMGPDLVSRPLPEDAILVARNIGPGELLDHAGRIRALVLDEGAHASHAAIIARALAIPAVIQTERMTRDANSGDRIVVDADLGRVHLRPEKAVADAYREKIQIAEEARARYRDLRELPAETADGTRVVLKMNAGVLADLPSIDISGAEGVGLYRTELQFIVRSHLPGREEQARLYSRIMDSAGAKEVIFRTLDIGSDKILPYMRRQEEPNPALGWRAIRVGLDRPRLFRMQIQALIRAAKGRTLSLMFPMVTEAAEFASARAMVFDEVERLSKLGYDRPKDLRIGMMLEVPALAFAPDTLFANADFVSVGGNDLMQFFFAADRENERVRGRYDALNHSFLALLRHIVGRCVAAGTPLSFCGESAGSVTDAIALSALGFRELSMRPASIGPVKQALRQIDLAAVEAVIDASAAAGETSARERLTAWLAGTRQP